MLTPGILQAVIRHVVTDLNTMPPVKTFFRDQESLVSLEADIDL